MINSQIPPQKIIDGKALAKEIKSLDKNKISNYLAQGLRPPCLCTILVGSDPASHIYVRNKRKAAAKMGINIEHHELPHKTTEQNLLSLIAKLNNNKQVDGILAQLPLPKHIDEQKIIVAIDPKKDIDGFHPENIGLHFFKRPRFLPCTARGVMSLIEKSGAKLSGANAVVVGRSRIAGKPIAQLLLDADATVTICHSFTKNLSQITKNADILVAAVGKPHFLGKNHIKKGTVVIDVGINRLQNSSLTGDVDAFSVAHKVGHITPVPGGVGPMTIAMLLKNTVEAYEHALE